MNEQMIQHILNELKSQEEEIAKLKEAHLDLKYKLMFIAAVLGSISGTAFNLLKGFMGM